MGKQETINMAKYLILALVLSITYYPIDSKAITYMPNVVHKTEVHFYFHDSTLANSTSAVEVVQAPGATEPFTGFGFIAMANAPLTDGPDLSSKVIGHGHGMWSGTSGPTEGPAIFMTITYSFTDGPYKGSSLSVMGMNDFTLPVRELPVVGGTGIFKMARGYALTRTYSSDLATRSFTGEYNVTVFH